MASTIYTTILTRGTKATLPSAEDGKIRFATDSEQLYIDVGNSHIEITDFVKGYTTAEILEIQSPLDKIYLSSDTFNLYYYDSDTTSWVNINILHEHSTSQITDLRTTAFVTIDNIDTTDGLDFGDEDEGELDFGDIDDEHGSRALNQMDFGNEETGGSTSEDGLDFGDEDNPTTEVEIIN